MYNAYNRGLEVKGQTLLNSAEDGGEWQSLSFGHSTRKDRTPSSNCSYQVRITNQLLILEQMVVNHISVKSVNEERTVVS
jgi:hypothetical protein